MPHDLTERLICLSERKTVLQYAYNYELMFAVHLQQNGGFKCNAVRKKLILQCAVFHTVHSHTVKHPLN